MRAREINLGIVETKNLAECLKVDFAVLYRAVVPGSTKEVEATIRKLQTLGISKRMEATAALLVEAHGSEVLSATQKHESDTARSWAAFVAGGLPAKSLAARLDRVKSFADDPHFGVREWAWMAVRRHVASDPELAIEILAGWTSDESPRVRRFASEATRPRGVWSEHIQLLKEKPELGLPVLAPLKGDPERYVQDSVANWLNDAAKSKPAWVTKLCAEWTKASASKATAYIVKRAQRSLK